MVKMFLRLALLVLACGAFVFSRVLVVRNDRPVGSLFWDSNRAGGKGRGAVKALSATGGGSSYVVGVQRVNDHNGPLSRIASVQKLVSSRVGSCADGVMNVSRVIGSRIRQGGRSNAQQVRWGQHGLNFAQQLAKRLRRKEGKDRKQDMDAKHVEMVRELEAEGEEALLDNDKWRLVGTKDDMRIWKRSANGPYGKEYPCVKVSRVVDAPADRVMDLIVDSGRVKEYNRYSQGRTDVQHLGPNTKIVRNRTQPPLSKKPHEFCTLMHVVKRGDGSRVMLTKFTDHPDVPRSKNYVRSEIILGVTEVRPHPKDQSKVVFTTVSHVKSAGVPAFMADKFSVKGVTDFVDNMEAALHGGKRPKRQTEESLTSSSSPSSRPAAA